MKISGTIADGMPANLKIISLLMKYSLLVALLLMAA